MRDNQNIEAKFVKLIYRNENFAIFATDKGFSAKGHIIDSVDMLLGEKLRLYGVMQKGRYGETFAFESYEFQKEQTKLYFFLLSVIGLGEKQAKAICEIAPTTLEFDAILNNEPAKLLQIKGIGQKRFEKILQGWEQKRQLRTLWEFLTPYGVTNKIVLKVYENLKEQSIALIQANPYIIANIKGIGFKKADIVARAMGIEAASHKRLRACIVYCLQNIMLLRGDTVAKRENFFEAVKEQSFVADEFVLEYEYFEQTLAHLQALNEVVVFENADQSYVSLPKYETMEKSIVRTLKSYKDAKKPQLHDAIEDFIKKYEKVEGVVLGQKQLQALHLANSGYKIFAVTGYAGTGKTTVSKAILQLFEKRYGYDSIVCCALSGVAANRVKKQSGYESMTIHSLLGFDNEKGGFAKNKDNPIDKAVVLVDEASMVDVGIFYALMQAIDFDKTTMILLGDPAQLPPVGAGEVFSDAVSLDLVQNVTLDTIYRQKEDAVIKLFAQEVRYGKVPIAYDKQYGDFFFIAKCVDTLQTQSCHEMILSYIQKIALRFKDEIEALAKEDIWAALTHFQIITPMKETPLGTKNLNTFVQTILHPKKTSQIETGGRIYKLHDKVIHLKNKNMDVILQEEFDKEQRQSKEVRVFNGQIGRIEFIDKEEDVIYVYYPNEKYYALYGVSDFNALHIDLAYAISGHKSQGSEYTNVVIPLTMSHYVMLNNKLLYTMMTRAKERLVFVGQKKAFEIGCKRKDETKRLTFMKFER
jgi:exodeoxyribonuclease V alpha subunit